MTFSLLIALPFLAIAVGLGKGGLGGAFAGIITPLVSIFMPVKEAIAVLLPMLIVGDWLALRVYWREWDNQEIRWLMPVGLLGVVAGTYLLVSLPTETLRHLLGILSLVIAVYKLIEPRLRQLQYQPHRWHTLLAGTLAGTASAVASAGGPVMTAYLLLQKTPPRTFIATTTLFFAVTNLARLPALFAADVFEWEKLRVVILFMPLVWVGAILGWRFIEVVNPVMFDRLMTVILIFAGIILIVL